MPPESLRDHVFTAFDTLGIHRAPSSARKGTFHLLGMHDTHLQDVRGPFRLLADVRRPLRESPVVEHDGALYVHSLRGLVSVDLSSEHAQAMAAFKTLKAQLFKMGAQLDFHVSSYSLSGKPNDLSQALGKHYDEFHENMDLGFRKCTGLQSVVLRVGAPPLQLAELKQSFEEAAKRTYRTVGRTGLHSVGAMKSRKKDASVTAYLPGMRPKQKPASASASRVAKRKVPVYLKRRPRRGSDIPGQLRMAFHETA